MLFTVLSFTAYPQLTGTKTVGGVGTPDYATIEAAIAALNLNGTTSPGVTFNVAGGHAETFSNITAGLITTQTGTASSPIVFQKSGGGTNPLITAALGGISANRDGIIIIAGGDYITFDGIDVLENSGNTNAQNQMEWGYALVKAAKTAPFNGCSYVTIKNCAITLNKSNTNAAGIYAGNHTSDTTTFLTLTASSDVMSNCTFQSNIISNVYYGFRMSGYTSNRVYPDSANVIDDNDISNFGGSSSSTYGMNIEYNADLTVSNNTVNGGSGGTGVVYGIRTGSLSITNIDIFNNTVQLTQSGSSLIYGITNSTGSAAGSGINNTVNIYNNTVENCSYPSSSSNSVWLIYNLASCANLNIYGNTIRNNTKSAGTGPMHCIYNSPTTATTNAQIYGNEILQQFFSWSNSWYSYNSWNKYLYLSK